MRLNKLELARFRQKCLSLNCASRDIEALIELWLDAHYSFTEFFRGIPQELLEKPFDTDGTTVLAVGAHVMGSALLDVAWCLKTAGLPVPDCELETCKAIQANTRPLITRNEVLQEANRLTEIVPPALAPLTSEKIYQHEPGSMSPELILEHAIVHFYRHRRQLDTRLHF